MEKLANRPLLLIKFGGGLLTDKLEPNKARLERIRPALSQLAQLYGSRSCSLIVGNGVGSFAHVPAKEYRTKEGIINEKSVLGAAKVKERAMAIHMLVYQEALTADLPFFSLSPSSFLELGSGEPYLSPLLNCLKHDLIPFIYGDVITDNRNGFGIYSTEKSLEIIAQKLKYSGWPKITMIHLGLTQGVYDSEGKTIPEITLENYAQVKDAVGGSYGVDVTGGMKHKVETALELAKHQITTIIASGKNFAFEDVLTGKIQSNKYTVIHF